MTAGALLVVRPGLCTTIQDEGRWGHQSQGVSVAGPMDPFSHRVANALVGNPRTAATMEISVVGPELVFDQERLVAVTGAEFEVTLNRHPVPVRQAVMVPAKGTLRFGVRRMGARAYLAVAGGFDVPPVLGSRATDISAGLGGLSGRALVVDDRVPFGVPTVYVSRAGTLRVTPPPRAPGIVRVLPGPDQDRFSENALDALQSAPYAVQSDSDRRGFRLDGPRLGHVRGADVISDATPVGTLQVPGSERPILLMADRQTTGGYPRIATVISADLGVAGQAAPGDTLTFRVCTPAEALAALIADEQYLLSLESTTS